MGVLTEIFVADQEELLSSYGHWFEVSDEIIETEMTNPFTNEVQKVQQYAKKSAVPLAGSAACAGHNDLPCWQGKGLDVVMLATLQTLVSNSNFDEALDSISKPALLSPNSDEESLHKLPTPLTVGLAELPEIEIPEIASKWVDSEEMQMLGIDPESLREIVKELKALAEPTVNQNKAMYLWWSL